MAISLTINGREASLKKGSSIEYVSENRIFTDADDYSMEIELPLADCPQNLDIFGMITRKDVDTGNIFFDAVLQDTKFFKNSASREQSQACLNSAEAPPILCNRGAVVITGITHESVKVQFIEKRSYQNFFPGFDETYIDELDLGMWPNYYQYNLSSSGHGASPRPGGGETVYATPAQLWARWEQSDYRHLWLMNSTPYANSNRTWARTLPGLQM